MSASLLQIIEARASEIPVRLDLTDEAQLDTVQNIASGLLARETDRGALLALEHQLIRAHESYPLAIHLAVKLARSKQQIDAIDRATHLSIVFAMYKEHQRIRPPSTENPVGEDFLRRKIQQLTWLFKDNPAVSWQLLTVDDGCPNGSGRIAQEIAQEMGTGDQIRVLFLSEAIAEGHPIVRSLADTSESQKGGSILLGMWEAAQEDHPNHAILFTDADLSTHLGQSGLLLQPILKDEAHAAIGSRRESASVVIKTGRRNTRGKLFIYLWKQLLPALADIVDTQCGFKAFRSDVVQQIASQSQEKGFAFDIELLLRSELGLSGSVTKVPIAWIDSEAASTTTHLEPYLPMLRSVVALYRHYLTPDPEADEFAALIESLDETAWNRLIDSMPAAIADGDPSRFAADSAVSAAQLGALAKG